MRMPREPQMAWLLPSGLALAMAIVGFQNQQEIGSLREEQEALSSAAISAGTSVRPEGRLVRPRSRERVDHQAEGRRIAAKLSATTGTEADAAAGVKLADDVLAMNAEQLRGAIYFLLTAGDTKRDHQSLQALNYLIGRLAEDHPREALAMLAETRADQPELLVFHEMNAVVEIAARQLAGSQPEVILKWFQDQKNNLEEGDAANVRFAVLRGVVRVNPAAALRWAAEEGISGTAFLAWNHQTADEKQASLAALRAWSDDPEVVKKAIRELVHQSAHGGHVSFDEVTQWADQAGLTSDELGFFVDPSVGNPGFDPVETARWLDWLGEKFPQDVVEHRIQRMREDHRIKVEVDKWLERRVAR